MKLFVTFLLAITFANTGISAGLSSASDLDAKIKSAGARATVRDLWRNQSEWNEFLKHVESGAEEWLKVADQLKPGTDAGQTETLKIALSNSIQNQPLNFLQIAWPVFGEGVCKDLQIEPTPAQHQAFMEKTRQALQRVNRDSVVARRDSCLRALESR